MVKNASGEEKFPPVSRAREENEPTVRRPVQRFFTLVGLLKYGIVLSAVLVYLPFTAWDKVPFTQDFQLPGHDITGNMFIQLSTFGVFIATIFLLAVAWSIMFTEGLIVNGSENRFDKRQPSYRRLEHIGTYRSTHIPAPADFFFSIPVTGKQFCWFTVVLAGPSLYFLISRAENFIRALTVAAAAFLIDYFVFILFCTPAALLDQSDPPLRGLFLAKNIWSLFGYQGEQEAAEYNWAFRRSAALQRRISWLLARLHIHYLLDPRTRLIYPAHFLATTIAAGLLLFWIGFDWVAYPGVLEVESAPIVYVYASVLLFVWYFAALNFHLGRVHISPIATLLFAVIVGYSIFGIDHQYGVTREESNIGRLTPVDVAKNTGRNLVVITAAGGGIWAAGWTTLALEKLIDQRPQLAHEIRLLSTVSGGSVGAAYFVQGLLNDPKYQKQMSGSPDADTLHQITVRATTSSLEAAAYGVAFRDFPRLVTGGLYHPILDRGYLLEREWARIAAGIIKGESVKKGAEEKGECWGDLKSCSFLHLREPISKHSVPAVIFNSTVMELGWRIMITPLDFDPNNEGERRGQTLSELLFGDSQAKAAANLPFWRAARLSATFSFVSPAVQADVLPHRLKGSNPGNVDSNAWGKHLVDGGYYDNFGVASALDWLQPVLEARLDKKETGLNFSRVLIVQLRGWPGKKAKDIKASLGAKAALIGPLDALFAIREGVAVSRDEIDVDRFAKYWNRRFNASGMDVQVASVDFVPPAGQPQGPLSWRLSPRDISNLTGSWVKDPKKKTPEGWTEDIQKSWCRLARFLDYPPKMDCKAIEATGQHGSAPKTIGVRAAADPALWTN